MTTVAERFATIRSQMATDAAKAMVDLAETLFASDQITEARLHVAEARNLDKAAADGKIAEMAEQLASKLRKRSAADQMAELDRAQASGDNVVTMPARGDR